MLTRVWAGTRRRLSVLTLGIIERLLAYYRREPLTLEALRELANGERHYHDPDAPWLTEVLRRAAQISLPELEQEEDPREMRRALHRQVVELIFDLEDEEERAVAERLRVRELEQLRIDIAAIQKTLTRNRVLMGQANVDPTGSFYRNLQEQVDRDEQRLQRLRQTERRLKSRR
jgi:hypothetical protein